MKLIIIVGIYLLSVIPNSHSHVNPCPQFWRYVRVAGNYQGLVTIKNPTYTDKFKVRLVLSLSGNLPTDYEGSFELDTDENTAKQDLQAGRDLNYKVLFPIQHPVPVLLDLQVNGRSICKGETAHGQITTTIKHIHILQSSQGASGYQQSYSPNTNYNNYQQNYNLGYRPQSQNTQPSYYQQNYYSTTPYSPLIDDAPIQFENSATNSVDAICGKPEERAVGLVVHGTSYKKGDWPWLTALFYRNEFICGGTLVSKNHVITAAHCVSDKKDYRKKISEMYFVLGAHNLNSQDSVKRSISTFIQHPDWDPLSEIFDADLAIAVLSSPVLFTRYIKPACLPNETPSTGIYNQIGTLAGWGKTETTYLSTDDPKKLQIPIVSNAECVKTHRDFAAIISPRTFCAGSRDGRGPCVGDSGGGFLVNQNERWFITGIVSASLRGTVYECNVNHYAVFTDVAKYSSWIRNYIE